MATQTILGFCLLEITTHDLLEGIDSHHHRHTKVLCVLNLFPHIAAAFLQKLKVLHRHTNKNTLH